MFQRTKNIEYATSKMAEQPKTAVEEGIDPALGEKEREELLS